MHNGFGVSLTSFNNSFCFVLACAQRLRFWVEWGRLSDSSSRHQQERRSRHRKILSACKYYCGDLNNGRVWYSAHRHVSNRFFPVTWLVWNISVSYIPTFSWFLLWVSLFPCRFNGCLTDIWIRSIYVTDLVCDRDLQAHTNDNQKGSQAINQILIMLL